MIYKFPVHSCGNFTVNLLLYVDGVLFGFLSVFCTLLRVFPVFLPSYLIIVRMKSDQNTPFWTKVVIYFMAWRGSDTWGLVLKTASVLDSVALHNKSVITPWTNCFFYCPVHPPHPPPSCLWEKLCRPSDRGVERDRKKCKQFPSVSFTHNALERSDQQLRGEKKKTKHTHTSGLSSSSSFSPLLLTPNPSIHLLGCSMMKSRRRRCPWACLTPLSAAPSISGLCWSRFQIEFGVHGSPARGRSPWVTAGGWILSIKKK